MLCCLACAQAAGLSSLLRDSTAQNTIFAPSDDAFDNLQRQIGVSTPELLANTNLVTQVHAVPGCAELSIEWPLGHATPGKA